MFARLVTLPPFQAPTSQHSYTSSPTTSCPPQPLRPSVCLSLPPSHAPTLYGFPPRTHGAPNPGFLFLSDPSPAVLLYILGPSWRNQLAHPPSSPATGNIVSNPCSRINGYAYIPIPNDAANEAQHCLRMKRCGALWTSTWLEPLLDVQDRPPQVAEKQIFGWPDGVGVWVFRTPGVLSKSARGDEADGLDEEEQMQAMLESVEMDEREGGAENMALLEWKLKGQEDMNGFCAVLRDAGAIFCKDLRECPEVVCLGLLEPEMWRNDWVPPGNLRGKWAWRGGT